MDARRFDALAKALNASRSRRAVFKALAASIVGGVFGATARGNVDAARFRPACLRTGQACGPAANPAHLACCSGICDATSQQCRETLNANCIDDPDCATGLVCRPNPTGLGARCLPPGGLGVKCAEHDDCASGFCDPYTHTCTNHCTGNTGSCSANSQCCSGICNALSGTCIAQLLPLGAACAANEDCATGVCRGGTCQVSGVAGQVCDEDTDCASGFLCAGAGPSCCAALGTTCASTSECCDNRFCVDLGTGATCIDASPPNLTDDSYSTPRDTALTVAAPGVLLNDAGVPLSVTAYDANTTLGGTVVMQPDGSFTYTPPSGVSSLPDDTFTYTVTNAAGTDSATVTIRIVAPPTANDDPNYQTPLATQLTVAAPGVLGNDTLNFATLSAYDAASVAGGVVLVNADGSFNYTPPSATYTGFDTFTYTVTNIAGSDSATVTVQVGIAPDAVNDSYTAGQDTTLNVAAPGVLGNDAVNAAAISAYVGITSQGGSVSLNLDGSFSYTPPTGLVSPPLDTFTYTLTNGVGSDSAIVSFTVIPPPDAVDDPSYTTPANTALTVAAPGVLGNDTLNSATLTTGTFATTAGGSVALSADGSFTYTPPADTATVDTFTYTLTNIAGSDKATVTITVGVAPVANDDTYQTPVDTQLTVAAPGVLGNDSVNVATISAYDATTTRGGSVTLNADGSFNYTPPSGLFSPPDDTFIYTLTNGLGSDTATVTIAILPPPVAADDGPYTTPENTPLSVNAASGVLGNDTVNGATISAFDATATDGGTVALNADGNFTYTPPSATYNGIDTFTYTLSNVSGSDSATVTIHVGSAPDAVNDSYLAGRNTPLTIPAPGLLGNDDVNNGALTTGTFATSRGGSVTINADGGFTYTPATNVVSPPDDTFSYTLANELGSDSATATITVVPPPVANDDPDYTTHRNTVLTVNAALGVLGNDTVNSATLSPTSATATSQGGSVTLSADGSFVYTPLTDFQGTDTFSYTLTNPAGSDTALVSILVGDPPIATDDGPFPVTGNISVDSANFTTPYDLRANDTLNLGDIVPGTATSVAAAAASPPIANNVTIRANGTFTYNPPPGFEGNDSFSYTLTNPIGSDTGTVSLTVSEVVWFVNNALGSNGDGRLSAPFNSLANFVSGAADEADDYIFLYSGSGNYAGGIALLAGQRLIGQGIALSTVITPANGSAALPGAGTAPTVVNTGGNAITLANGNTVRGLNVTAANNVAIGGTLGNAATTIGDVGVSTSSTGGGLAFTGGNAAVNVSAFSLTQGGSGCAVDVTTRAGGTITFANDAIISATAGTGVNISGATAASTVTFTGTVDLGTSGSRLGATAVTVNHNSTASTTTFANLDIFTGAATGLVASGGGTLTVTTGTIDSSAGALSATSLALGTTFTSVTSAGGTNNVALTSATGTLNMQGGALSGASGTAFLVSGGSAAVTYSGTVSKTGAASAGRVIDINGPTGGSVTFNGAAISGSGTGNTGIRVNSAAGTIAIANATLDTSTSTAVTLSSNTATMSFSNLKVTTTTGNGLDASNASLNGTLTVTAGSGFSSLTSGSGTALKVVNTNIGVGNLNFRSISANGGTNGVLLSGTGTSGGLSVTGNGSAGTGGTIQSMSGDGLKFTNTQSVSLAWMSITANNGNGVYGEGVSGGSFSNFSIANSSVTNNDADNLGTAESGLRFDGQLAGAWAITNTTVSGTKGDQVRITPTGGTISNLAVSGSTFGPGPVGTGGNGIALVTGGTANVKVTVSGASLFTSNPASGFLTTIAAGTSTIIIKDSTFQDNNIGIDLGSSSSGVQTINVDNNTLLRHNLNAVNIVGDGVINGTINNNKIGNGTPDSGVKDYYDIGVSHRSSSNWVLAITNNVLNNSDFEGIFLRTGDITGNTGRMDLTLTGNTVFPPDDNSGFPAFPRGMHIRSRQGTTLCANIANNESQGNGGVGYHLQESDTSQLLLQGFTTNGTTTLINNGNKTNGAAATVDTAGEPFSGACIAQTAPAPS